MPKQSDAIQTATYVFKHLRFGFSFFLLPVFLFALSAADTPLLFSAVIAFFVLHVLVYPSSNAYNSLMDQDTESIGGLEKPPPAPPVLWLITLFLDALALAIIMVINPLASIVLLAYILASRAYSWRRIRLKKHPIAGYLTVVIFQGAVIFYFTILLSDAMYRFNAFPDLQVLLGMLMASVLIGSSYPLTQVYQHKQDRKDGVQTISMLLGVKGTFIFSLWMLIFFIILLLLYVWQFGRWYDVPVFALCNLPAAIIFSKWHKKVQLNEQNADFRHAMKMSLTGAGCINIFFLYLLIIEHLY